MNNIPRKDLAVSLEFDLGGFPAFYKDSNVELQKGKWVTGVQVSWWQNQR